MTWNVLEDGSYIVQTELGDIATCSGAQAVFIVACVNALAGIPQSDLELLAGLSPTTRLMALSGAINRTLGSILP